MKVWTVHLRRDAEPLLIREGFAPFAMLLGPIWLLWHRAWIPAVFVLGLEAAITTLLDDPIGEALDALFSVALGLMGRDLLRWMATLRGYLLAHVLVARDETEALLRLLTHRPDLAGWFMPPGAAA